ncbi:leucine-rich repeat protein [Tanacetum coccineum]
MAVMRLIITRCCHSSRRSPCSGKKVLTLVERFLFIFCVGVETSASSARFLSGTTAFKEPFLMNLAVYLGYVIFILTETTSLESSAKTCLVVLTSNVLSLARNKLVGSIPKEISLFSKLTGLEISKNKLTGGIPSFLGNVTSMEVFSCVENPLGGSNPDTLGLLICLVTFYSGAEFILECITSFHFNLSLLARFSLAENHLTGSLPSEIQLPNLENLQLVALELAKLQKLTGVLPVSIEYGMGSEMTSSGDVYSFGILLLELMTGKKPTDNMFNEVCCKIRSECSKKVEECLAATIKIGVSCSVDSPPQRMKIDIVVNELQSILNVLQSLSSSLYGEVESNCDKE